MPLIQAKNVAMEKARQEGKDDVERILPGLQKQLFNLNTLGFSDNDLLPEEDKGKTFDKEKAKSVYENPANLVLISETKDFLDKTKKREDLDEGEYFIVRGHNITQNPLKETDIASLDVSIIPEEENLQICQENGTYQVSFTQTLSVTATPEIKQSIKHCKGHEKTHEFFWKSDAEKDLESKKKSLRKDKNASKIDSYEVYIATGGVFKDYAVVSKWHHTDNKKSCDHFKMEEKINQAAKEEDSWTIDNPEQLAHIESKPSCRLLYSNVAQGPETRLINGKPVTRQIWGRQLYFSCEPHSDSKCMQLRAQGGVLKGKKCLEQNFFGECDLWEKTYDLGKKGAFQQTKASFKGDEVWGLNEGFDTSYEKNQDFGPVISTLSILSELEKDIKKTGPNFSEKVKIFKGEKFGCQKTFLSGDIFDCCRDLDGLAVDIKLARCTAEEKCLAKQRHDGKCVFIGTQKLKLGTVTEHVYCCFPSKLARVLQEQGRKQLKIDWGNAENPKCRGLKLKELQNINFSAIDLTEVMDDIKIDKQVYEKKLKDSVGSLQTKVQTDIDKKRKELTNKPKDLEVQPENKGENNG